MAVNVKGGPLEFSAIIDENQLQATIRKIEAQLQGLTRTAEQEAGAIDNLVRKTTQAIAAYASFATATNFISSIVRVRGEFQQLEVAFATMLKSKEKADQLMAQAVELAAKTPFGLQDVGSGAKQLLAYGFASEEVIETLRRLGDVAAGVGAPLNDIVYLYGTTRTQGRLYAQDLMQFTSRGIPIIAELAKQFGVADDEVKKLVESGKVGFPEVQKVIMSLTSEGGIFFNLMEEQSKTLTGQISNLQDAWAQMLNNIGRSNEGVFNTAISTATELVENYETVLDILKVLVITYGAYRAAIIVTNAVTAISTSLTIGWTAAEILRYQAMLLSDKAMKLLNATMLSNPAVAVTTAIAALVAGLIIFSKETTNVRQSTELLTEAQEESAKTYSEQEAKIRTHLTTLKAGNTTERQRLDIYKQLRDINPDLVKGLDAQNLSYEALIKNVNVYLAALRSQLAIDANQDAIKGSIKQEQAIRALIKAQEARIKETEELDKRRTKVAGAPEGGVFVGGMFTTTDAEKRALKELQDQLAEQEKVTEDLGKAGADLNKTSEETEKTKRRTVDIIQQEIKALQDERDKISATSKEYAGYTKRIQLLNKELEAIIGKQGAKAADKRADSLKKLWEDIADAEQDARRSGMAKEESEIDKINARYDELKKKAEELKAGEMALQRIEGSRQTEIGNERVRAEADAYKDSLEAQQKIFEQFEEAKKDFGIDMARQMFGEMFGEQTKGFDSFLAYLQAEADKFRAAPNTLGSQLRLQAIGAAYTDADKAQRDRDLKEEQDRLKRVIESTISFNRQRKQLEQQYQKDLATLRKNFTGQELKEREAILTENYKRDLSDLQSHIARQSALYKKLNEDILTMMRDQLRQRARELKKILENDTSLTPQMKADIQSAIEEVENLLRATNDVTRAMQKLSEELSGIAGIFGDLASGIGGANEGLADTLATMGSIIEIGANAAAAAGQFASGDIVGGVASTVRAITGIFQIGAKARESERQAQAEILEFQQRILSGEIEITQVYAERERLQVRLNKLKLQGLQDEKKLLEEQRKTTQDQFDMVLEQLQKESAVISKAGEKYGGFLGIGRKTRAVDITQTLSGMSYDDLEKLFLKGQLEGKAKELFELLQRIKQEGADIDALLLQNAEEAKQVLTGATSESITDSIVDGFRNGLRSARDFANNFEELMRNAVLQSLKMQALEGPLQEFYNQFASRAESDNMLTEEEIRILRENFNNIINEASRKFDELQKITNMDLSSAASGSGNSLAGAIRGITEQQADLLAAQFGGLRMTALDQLRIATQNLNTLQAIQNHTSNLGPMYRLLQRLEVNGLKAI